MNIEDIAKNVIKDTNGIYYSKSNSTISYPEEGNESFMQIEDDSFWFLHRNNIISESIKKHNTNNIFFDIGGGNGFVSKRLQDDGIDVVLVEPGKAGALNGNKRGIKHVVCSTLEDAAFVPEKIESVGLFDVVEHIENDHEFLNNINKYMKANGLIYITVPAYNGLWSNEDDDAGHFRRYTNSTLNALLKSTGFSVMYSTYLFSILPLPIFLLRSLPSKLGLNKGSNNLEKHQKEHTAKRGILNKVIQKLWNWELSKVKKGKKIPFGSSCFVIAKKVMKTI